MDNVEVLRKLINEDGITFIKTNKENIDLQWDSFLKTNGFVCGVDLASGTDYTG